MTVKYICFAKQTILKCKQKFFDNKAPKKISL